MKQRSSDQSDWLIDFIIPLSYYRPPSPHDVDDGIVNHQFIGRDRLLERFRTILSEPKTKRGSFLITGYRGSGKTSFVNRVVADLKTRPWWKLPKRKIFDIRVNLGNTQVIDTRELLFDIASTLYNQLHRKSKYWIVKMILVLLYIPFTATLALYLVDDQIPANIYNTFSSNNVWFSGLILVSVLTAFLLISRVYKTRTLKAKRVIKPLIDRTLNTVHHTTDWGPPELSLPALFTAPKVATGTFTATRKKVSNPVTARQLEYGIITALDIFARKSLSFWTYRIVIVFDELDKISPIAQLAGKAGASRKTKIDAMLGNIKNLITTGKAFMFFVGDREMYDSYYSERTSTSALYESIFDDAVYLPSLLTDNSDGLGAKLASMIEVYVCRHLMDARLAQKAWRLHKARHEALHTPQKYRGASAVQYRYDYYRLGVYFGYLVHLGVPDRLARNTILVLQNLIQYLAVHSWGNCKRLASLFSTFLVPGVDAQSIRDHQLRSHLPMESQYYLRISLWDLQRIILSSNIYIMLHNELSHQLSNYDDKLTVSAFSMLHQILKFHDIAFDRHYLNILNEDPQTSSPLELERITGTLLNRVLRPFLRRIRNGIYEYRFLTIFEQEMQYVAQASAIESAAFSFNFDPQSKIPSNRQDNKPEGALFSGHAEAHALTKEGDLHYWRRYWEACLISYLRAIALLEKDYDKRLTNKMRLLIKLYLKVGHVEERRQNFATALASYQSATELARGLGYPSKKSTSAKLPGYQLLEQPDLCRLYLQLKRPPLDSKAVNVQSLQLEGRYRFGAFQLFSGNYAEAIRVFSEVTRDAPQGSLICANAKTRIIFARSLAMFRKLDEQIWAVGDLDSKLQILTNFLAYETPNLLPLTEELGQTASALNDSGHTVEASYTYLGAILIPVFLLEAFPWRRLRKVGFQENESTKDMLNEIRRHIERSKAFNQAATKIISDQYHKAFSHFLYTWANYGVSGGKDFAEEVHQKIFFANPADILLRDKVPNGEEWTQDERRNVCRELAFWQHSLLCQTHMLLQMWEFHSEKKFFGNDEAPVFAQGYVLPHSVRLYVTTLIISGREYAAQARNLLQEDTSATANWVRILEVSSRCLETLYRAALFFDRFSANDQEVMLPPPFLVYYTLWEILFDFVSALARCECNTRSYRELVALLKDALVLGARTERPVRIFADLEFVRTKLLTCLSDSYSLTSLDSNSCQTVLRTKYFLDDDYEDPLFLLDWAFFVLYAPSAHIHSEVVKSEHAALSKELGNRRKQKSMPNNHSCPKCGGFYRELARIRHPGEDLT